MVVWFSVTDNQYLSVSLILNFFFCHREDPVYFEFPELKGHTRRDYWLAIIREVLHVHEFIRKFGLSEIQRVEALSKAIIGIFQYRAVKEVFHIIPSRSKTLLPFSLAENLPKGDEILEALHGHLELLCMRTECTACETLPDVKPLGGLLPVSMLELTRKGFTLMKKADGIEENVSQIGAFYVGDRSPLDKAVWQSICYSGKAETARATVEQVKVEGIDTNLAVMKVGCSMYYYGMMKLVNRAISLIKKMGYE